MKKTVNIRNIIIVMLCITIIFMGIGFAYLSVILNEKNNEKTKMESYESYKETPYKNHTARKIFLFISLIAIFVCVLVNFLTFNGSFWSLFVVGGIFYLWILIRFTIMSRQNIALKLLLQAIGIGLILFFIQLENRSVHWLMPYALPFMMVATTFAITLKYIFIVSLKKEIFKKTFLYASLIHIFLKIAITHGKFIKICNHF